MHPVEIELYGKKYHLKSDDPDNIRKCASFLDSYISDVNKKLNIMDSAPLFLFSALFLTEDFLKLKADFDALSTKLERIEKLLTQNIK
ncbi:MAG: cell division protein ZapA [Candidatus Cloacimonadota bacterium]|nr:cell division protein ZapA [Candidatus Cloacimonadota bacterium]